MLSPFMMAGGGEEFRRAQDRAQDATAKSQARRAQSAALELGSRLDRLAMTCEALWSILRDKLGMTDDELLDRVTQLDLTDGRLDGKVTRSAVSCPKCGRAIARRFPNCMYCGQPVMHDPFA